MLRQWLKKVTQLSAIGVAELAAVVGAIISALRAWELYETPLRELLLMFIVSTFVIVMYVLRKVEDNVRGSG